MVANPLDNRRMAQRRSILPSACVNIHNGDSLARIRQTVRQTLKEVLEQQTQNSGGKFEIDGLAQMTDSAKPIALRIVWGIIFFACLALFTFQCRTQLLYYISQPVAVDVQIIDVEEVEYPAFSFFAQNPRGLQVITQTLLNKTNLTPLECNNPLLTMMKSGTGMSAREVWNQLDTREVILDTQVKARKKRYKLRIEDGSCPFGKSVTLELDKKIPYEGIYTELYVVLNSTRGDCAQSQVTGTIQRTGLPPDLRITWSFNSGATLHFSLFVLKYEFVNRRGQPCIDDDAYYACKFKCAAVEFAKLSCRFPFFPDTMTMETCYFSEKANLTVPYITFLRDYLRLRCAECPRRCQETIWHSGLNFVRKNKEPISYLSWYFQNNQITIIKERFSYDFSGLMSDVGGNMGLCLNMCLLSIFKICYNILLVLMPSTTFKKQSRRKVQPAKTDNSTVVRHIHRLIREDLRKLQAILGTGNGTLPSVLTTYASHRKKYFRFIIVLACFACSILFIRIRLIRYLSIPTRVIVEILDPIKVNFPNITFCGYTLDIIKRWRKLAISNRNMTKNKIPDWSDLHLLDLLDAPKMNATRLWGISSVYNEFNRSMNMGEVFLGYPSVYNVTSRTIHLPEGDCIEYNVGEQIHTGTQTLFSAIMPSKAFGAMGKEMLELNRAYYSVYVTPPNIPFHLSTRRHFPYTSVEIMFLEHRKVTRLNLARSPCTDIDTSNDCYHHCYQVMISRLEIKCRLPYMRISLDIPTCTNRSTAAQAAKIYLDFAFAFDPANYKECTCLHPCKQIVTELSEYTEPLDMLKMTIIMALFMTNIQQHFKEIYADSLPTVISDVGGNLGVTLGLSFLSIFSIFESLVLAALSKLENSRKRLQLSKKRKALANAPSNHAKLFRARTEENRGNSIRRKFKPMLHKENLVLEFKSRNPYNP